MRKSWIYRILAGARFFARQNGLVRTLQFLALRVRGSREPFQFKVEGKRFLIRPDSSDLLVTSACFQDKEFQTLRELSFRQPVRFIVDAGAYIGASSVALLDMFPQAVILALEPDEQNYRLLVYNVRGHNAIIPRRVALGSENGLLSLYRNFGRDWSVGTTNRSGVEKSVQVVDCTTIQEICREFKEFGRIDVLKMDIEGSEYDVLANADQWIERIGAIMVEPHEFIKVGCKRRFFLSTAGFKDHFCKGEKLLAVNPAFVD